MRRLDDAEGFGVGTRWREIRAMFGKSASEEMTVTEVDPGRSYTAQAQHGKAHYTSVMSVEPSGDSGCVLSMHFGRRGHGGAQQDPGRGGREADGGEHKKLMQQDLADIAEAAEQRVS